MSTFSEYFKDVDDWADYATDVMRYCFYEEKARTGNVDKNVVMNGHRVLFETECVSKTCGFMGCRIFSKPA